MMKGRSLLSFLSETVTIVSSLIPAEEAQRASEQVQAAIADHHGELDHLMSFVADNSALTKLVRQLLDEISHDIMVPLGSATFFPGQLIHTVLIVEWYYAERTSKQTVEILRRREVFGISSGGSEGQFIAVSNFFDSIAAEAKALVASASLIACNAGVECELFIEKVKESKLEVGYNMMNDKYVNLIEAGAIDPAKDDEVCSAECCISGWNGSNDTGYSDGEAQAEGSCGYISTRPTCHLSARIGLLLLWSS